MSNGSVIFSRFFKRGFLERVDTVSSQETIYGLSLDLTASTSDAKWLIWREINNGEIQVQWAKKSGTPTADYVHVWDDRATLFDPVPFGNPNSLVFDGTDEYIDLGDNYTFNQSTAFSWSFWVKIQNTAAQRCFISKTSQDANVYGYSFQHNNAGKLFAQVRASGNLRAHTYSTVLSPLTWYHICFTFDGGANMNGLKAYINAAVEPAPASAALSAWTVTDPLIFGARGTGFRYSGNMNNVTVWNKELSSSEVTELYNSGSPQDPNTTSMSANLLSWWKLSVNDNFPTEVDQESTVNGTLVNMESTDYSGDVP